MASIKQLTPAQIRQNQLRDLYLDLYPMIEEDFVHRRDLETLHKAINALSARQVAAFEALRLIFNGHTHPYISNGVPLITSPTVTPATTGMSPSRLMPRDTFGLSLIEPPAPPFQLTKKRRGRKSAIQPFKVSE